jgi:hypothetical protein
VVREGRLEVLEHLGEGDRERREALDDGRVGDGTGIRLSPILFADGR